MKELLKNKQQASIPASSFDNYDEPVTIDINEVPSETVKVSEDNSQTDQNDTDQQTATNNETHTKDSNELPNTATSLYNILTIGILLIAAALTLYIYNRRKVNNQ
ncbi:LPXTG-motif cell wall-anchored protein [Gracilibacillus halotolerans]|uniref:LPXTG-motif cell wall-anchored protein n=1 Tax=Gracilibacillus halotolerans TaxID=74386 RepID=A0A841RMJ5_9BACI|nr:LPXTG cell wall anchor domain-containing protein [Gracilibacillus halotolerans]MBB6512853.1 LPXTG-motif cell wall-anchored protein [Gracilibacillus halotolerans]